MAQDTGMLTGKNTSFVSPENRFGLLGEEIGEKCCFNGSVTVALSVIYCEKMTKVCWTERDQEDQVHDDTTRKVAPVLGSMR
jgi:hypothetical protein